METRKRRIKNADKPFPTHIALKRDEMTRLRAYGARIGAAMSPRQVVLYLLTQAEKSNGNP